MNLNKPTGIILLLIWCLFMGVTAISIGFGAAFPALNRISAPFVCPNGDMRVDSTTYNPSPGTTVTTLDWQCVDRRTGEAQPVNEMSMFLFNGLIYGTLLFAIIMLWWWISNRRRAQRVTERAALGASDIYTSSGTHVASLDKYELQELTRQYKDGQYSEKDYQRKRKKILDHAAGRTATSSSVTTPSASYASSGSSQDIELQELKRMLDEGQLTNVEYWQKLGKITDNSVSQAKAALAATSSDRPAKANNMERELAQLKNLLDKGLITDQDYEQKKAQILSQL